MIKPKRLKRGDKIAIVSLSWGGLGDAHLIHKYEIAKERLETEYGLEVVCMPHTLKGSQFIAKHPELRAQDFMDALKDKTVAAIFCAIGGDDSIRLLPYIDFQVITENPKILMGYSDTTVNHFMMYKAGVVSFYGPSIMAEFAQYTNMFDYTKQAVHDILFGEWSTYELKSSETWSDDYIPWLEENRDKELKTRPEEHGYEIINGIGTVCGKLLGGCLDVFMMIIGTSIWPSLDEWKDAILFIETSE